MYHIIGADGKKYGPVTDATIREWITSGRCVSSTPIQVEGSTQWKQLSHMPEFAPALAALPPKISAPPILATPSPAPAKSKTNPLVYVGIAFGAIILGIFLAIFLLGMFASAAIDRTVQARSAAQSTVCKANLTSLAQSVRDYAADHGDQLPKATTWCDDIKASTPTGSFECPCAQGQICAYAYNKKLAGIKLKDANPRTVLLFESDAGWNGSGGVEALTNRYHVALRGSGVAPGHRIFHVVFVDGSFASIPEPGLSALRWEP